MVALRVKCPATSANLGAGFDLCGLALAEPYDILSVGVAQDGADSFESSGAYPVPPIELNVVSPVIKALRRDFSISEKIGIRLSKGIPPASGLGSSGASSAGIAVAFNELFGLGLGREQLVHYASLGEALASGSPHKDNVAPAIAGGVCVLVKDEPVRLARFDPPAGLVIGVLRTNATKPSTEFARSVLPAMIRRRDHHFNASRLSMLLNSLFEGDAALFVESLDDAVVEPARAQAGILPRLSELRALCRERGFGACASGAGPALLVAGVEGNKNGRALEQEIMELYAGMKPALAWTGVSHSGCAVIG
jgi:homoserine kinase